MGAAMENTVNSLKRIITIMFMLMFARKRCTSSSICSNFFLKRSARKMRTVPMAQKMYSTIVKKVESAYTCGHSVEWITKVETTVIRSTTEKKLNVIRINMNKGMM